MVVLARKSVAVLISILLAVSAVMVLAALPDTSHAATKPYMKTLKLKWDLKKNRTLKFKQAVCGLGKKSGTVKMTNFKISKATRKGYKKLTFKLTFTKKYSLSKTQVHKCVNNKTFKKYGEVGGGQFFTVVDAKTGRSLEIPNKAGVTVTGSWIFKGNKKVTDHDGCWVRLPKCSTAKITIIYPENYKNLCIGAGGYNLPYSTSSDKAYWSGKKKFGKTSYYTKGKTNSHWMLVK